MKKARFVLSALLFGFALLAFLLPWHSFGHWMYPAAGVLSVLSVSAITILAFSFFRVTETWEGDYCFDPANPFWRLMLNLYSSDWGERVSLCKAFWLTALTVVVAAWCVFLVGFLAYAGYQSPKTLFIYPGIALLIFIMSGVDKLTDKYRAAKHAVSGFLIAVVAACIGFLTFEGVVHLMHKYHCFVWLAILFFIGYVVSVLAGIAAVVGIVAGIYHLVPALRSSWLGRLTAAFKEKTCPVLFVCNHPDAGYTD